MRGSIFSAGRGGDRMSGGYNEDDWDRTRQMPRHGVQQPARPEPPRGPVINAGRLWAGGVATAIVAALIGLVGLLIVRALLQIPYLAPVKSGALGDSRTVILCVSAAVAALAATGLAHLLLLSTPRPMAYFGWIAGLLTAVAVVLPILNDDTLAVSLATGVIHLVIGLAIISLVTGAALSASTRA
ncbi:MAG: hypothetical protein JWR81_58 [Pseudonocardia sp.]|nr:hypothetical protein [Pseudonocardia sp.]MDT7612888.1 hypothetical protein [Pseudonocardiales bacterium]